MSKQNSETVLFLKKKPGELGGKLGYGESSPSGLEIEDPPLQIPKAHFGGGHKSWLFFWQIGAKETSGELARPHVWSPC